MSDSTEYDPNSKDLTDDPNFPAPKCGVCGIPWADRMGIMGVCLCNKALKEDLKDSLETHNEFYPLLGWSCCAYGRNRIHSTTTSPCIHVAR